MLHLFLSAVLLGIRSRSFLILEGIALHLRLGVLKARGLPPTDGGSGGSTMDD